MPVVNVDGFNFSRGTAASPSPETGGPRPDLSDPTPAYKRLPRGTDVRLDENRRATRAERRSEYHERMDAKAEARAELQREREAGIWIGLALALLLLGRPEKARRERTEAVRVPVRND